jgi:hypothetical protein
VNKNPPEEFESVLAIITRQTDLGLSQWYEVVYYDVWEKEWKSYRGSDTFDLADDRVINWVYCNEVFDKEN